MYEKVVAWIVTRWKAVIAFISLVATALLFYLKSKDQKKVLEKANESHEKELNAIKEAQTSLEKGLEDIKQKEEKSLQDAQEKHQKEKQRVKDKKDEFVKDSLENPGLAKEIADRIGADFVKTED